MGAEFDRLPRAVLNTFVSLFVSLIHKTVKLAEGRAHIFVLQGMEGPCQFGIVMSKLSGSRVRVKVPHLPQVSHKMGIATSVLEKNVLDKTCGSGLKKVFWTFSIKIKKMSPRGLESKMGPDGMLCSLNGSGIFHMCVAV